MSTATGVQPAPDVVVTGIGLHSAFGNGEQTRDAVARGQHGVRLCSVAGADDASRIVAAPAPSPRIEPFLKDRKLAKYMGPATRMAVAAAGHALRDAGLLENHEARANTSLFVSTGRIAFDVGSMEPALVRSCDTQGRLDLARLGADGLRVCHPLLSFQTLLNMPLGLVSIVFGLTGWNATLYPSAEQGGMCFEAAVRGIRARRFARALVGGAVHGTALLPVCTWSALGWLAATPEAATPFDPAHQGLCPADAAAFLVLESSTEAAARGALPLARLGPVLVRRLPADGSLPRVWDTAPWSEHSPPLRPPSRVLSTGNLDWNADQAELHALAPDAAQAGVRVSSLDGVLGYCGAAAVPVLAAIGVQMLGLVTQAAPPSPEVSPTTSMVVPPAEAMTHPVPSVVVSASSPEGGRSGLLLVRPWGAL